jgi:hypothetical protein
MKKIGDYPGLCKYKSERAAMGLEMGIFPKTATSNNPASLKLPFVVEQGVQKPATFRIL